MDYITTKKNILNYLLGAKRFTNIKNNIVTVPTIFLNITAKHLSLNFSSNTSEIQKLFLKF